MTARSTTLLFVILALLTGDVQASSISANDQPALVFVLITSPDDITRFATTQLPLYARLENGFITGADQAAQQALRSTGLSIQVLDLELHPGTYYLAQIHSGRPAVNIASYGKILLEIQNGVFLSIDPSKISILAQAGVELQAVNLSPKPLPTPKAEEVFPYTALPDPTIQAMINQVAPDQVYAYDRQLAGELPVWVDGGWYTITTRYTNSGTSIQKATHYVGQHMQNLGMNVDYHIWSNATNPDVIGEINGTVNPDDIFIIGAHLDDVSGTPGADDNASGSVATLLAADILSQYDWECTLRFAFWTGEEQGLLGSKAYAQEAYNAGENIRGYLNLDMIAWNTLNSAPYINLIYSNGISGSYALATLFSNVIGAYNLDLLTRFGTGITGSDHSSFWMYNYNSILAIEDDLGGDFNPNYHQIGDTPAHTDLAYFTNFVKASIATFAHETGCLIPPGNGNLDGHVTATGDGLPIQGAKVIANNDDLQLYRTTTDASGYYTMTLPVDTYAVNVFANGYIPGEINGLQIISGTTTTQDFTLQAGCESIEDLDFTWTPVEPYTGDEVTFKATSGGTPPVDFQWNFGDSYTGTEEIVSHTYTDAGTYTVTLAANNSCSSPTISQDLIISQREWQLYFPLVER